MGNHHRFESQLKFLKNGGLKALNPRLRASRLSRSQRARLRLLLALTLTATGCLVACGRTSGPPGRVVPKAFLNMPQRAAGTIPPLLSQTGVFTDVRTLAPAPGLMPYDLVVAFWSDGAVKSRLVAIPNAKVGFSATDEWRFPPGTVFVKTFELPVDETNPSSRRRLETRLLVRDADGGVYGVVYKWRADLSDADLLKDSLTEPIQIRTKSGGARSQTWYYPSRKDCLECHNARAGGVLGVKTRQLNTALKYPSGRLENQLKAWDDLQLLAPSIRGTDPSTLPRLAAASDTARSLEDRARSYLDANCSQCHRPGDTVAYFDARYSTPLVQQGIVDGPVLIDEGIDHPRVVAPRDIWRSIAYMRIDTLDDIKMPPLARETIDVQGVSLVRAWIESLPGRAVLAPPAIAPAGGSFHSAVSVTLQTDDPQAEIHYTLDGSEPGRNDPLYRAPIRLKDSSVVRARAYRDGYVHSVTTQSVFIFGN
ncbi:MAG TPA: chitobiase/beta-hexosaminidase C-terminal domain-containing protein [Steroidobacteraceae bacterium]|jgi:uncharacterized repeat protein (TIGR03806 family)|nr:chitobiase/beta-hexosaminidase C-terminal domain-containing protein [Steroidobacteraceae bacterium]